ncbi:hypothetical protein [Sphingomonas sp. LM7]|uniref:hypothetical protein n=1 Tax=Sphingomonas sp. LM7 TaxID=1938607 RepID=UPI000983A89B|nr:hypothetical protein [Sphingomonas sp. LM7]AQR73888.1 hypothetical protein BXU08_09725 [Sphingomonas sp. LM7]
MLKSILLATSMLVAAPAFAQETPTPETTQNQPQTPPATEAPATTDDAAPGTQGSGTVEEAPAAAPAPATETAQPTPTAPAQPATTPEPAQPATAPAPEAAPTGTTGAGTAAAAQPAATQDQVAQAVTRDFGTYDKDANGALSDVEFGAWMGTLRKASEPAFVPGSAEANVWLGQAFASADADKSKTVNQAELTTFLTPKS